MPGGYTTPILARLQDGQMHRPRGLPSTASESSAGGMRLRRLLDIRLRFRVRAAVVANKSTGSCGADSNMLITPGSLRQPILVMALILETQIMTSRRENGMEMEPDVSTRHPSIRAIDWITTKRYNPARTWTAEETQWALALHSVCLGGGPGGYQFIGQTTDGIDADRRVRFASPGCWFFDRIRF